MLQILFLGDRKEIKFKCFFLLTVQVKFIMFSAQKRVEVIGFMYRLRLFGNFFCPGDYSTGPAYRSRYSDLLRAERSGDRIPARHSMRVQNGAQADPTSRKIRSDSFPTVRRPENGAENPPPSIAEVANGLGLCLHLPSVPT